MARYQLRPLVPMDDDAILMQDWADRPTSTLTCVSYAIYSDASHWLNDMIMSPGLWPPDLERNDDEADVP